MGISTTTLSMTALTDLTAVFVHFESVLTEFVALKVWTRRSRFGWRCAWADVTSGDFVLGPAVFTKHSASHRLTGGGLWKRVTSTDFTSSGLFLCPPMLTPHEASYWRAPLRFWLTHAWFGCGWRSATADVTPSGLILGPPVFTSHPASHRFTPRGRLRCRRVAPAHVTSWNNNKNSRNSKFNSLKTINSSTACLSDAWWGLTKSGLIVFF